MSALPREVRRKIKAAEKLHEKAYGTQSAEGTPPAEVSPAPAEATPPVEQPAAPEATIETVPPAVQPSIEETPPPASPEVGETPPDGSTDAQKWEHKYNVLNGKYKAEVPRLQKNVKDLSGQVSQLQSVLSSLESVKPAEAAPPGTPEAATKLLKDEEIEDYGSDLIDVVKRAAREELAPEVNRLELENAELRRQMGTVVETSAVNARQGVYDTLDTQIPNWRELNSDQSYLAWLDTLDAYTNRMRRELLNEAFETNDAARVVAFFKGYLNENAVVSPATEETPAPAPRQAQVDMASLAAPGKPRGGSAPGTQEGQQTWRQVEISAFYADVRRGKFKNDPKGKLKIEKSIMAAVNSNRIVA